MWADKSLIVRWLLGSISLLLPVPSVWCGSVAVVLRPAVEVNHSPVLLSDLLPDDANPAIQKASASVVLCQAPQPGSVRRLQGDQILRSLASHPDLLSALSIPPRVTIRDSRQPIPQASVREAIAVFLHAHAWGDLPQTTRLEWPESLAARQEHARLQVTEGAWDHRQQAVQFRLRCTQRSACGDFLVHVVLPASVADAWQQRLVPPASPHLTSAANSVASGPVLAQRGKPAVLILQGGGMRILLTVICTEPGALNQRIRVFDRHSQHAFYADVVGEGLLHASL